MFQRQVWWRVRVRCGDRCNIWKTNCFGCMRVGSPNSSSGSCDAATSASDAGEGYNACALNEQKILLRSR